MKSITSLLLLWSVALALRVPGRVAAFRATPRAATRTRAKSAPTTCILRASNGATSAVSRRDVLLSSSIVVSGMLFLPTPSTNANAAPAANEAASYQGVYSDPNHPRGYRIIYGDNKKATMKLQDGPSGVVYEVPVKVGGNKAQLTFDFSCKGGPSNVVGIVDDGNSAGTTTINFPDGNAWKKVTDGIAGVYKSENNGDLEFDYSSVRQWKGAEYKVELMKGPDTIASFGAKAGGKKGYFEYPGEFNKAGFINEDEKTISFRDGMVWTRF